MRSTITAALLGALLLAASCSESPPPSNATRAQPVLQDPAEGATERMQNVQADLDALANMSAEERSFTLRNRERQRRENRNRPCGPDNPC